VNKDSEQHSSFFETLKRDYSENLILDTETLPDYARDASEINVRPSAIFFAENESEIIDVLKQCRAENIPIVFRGAGTGYTGGAVPVSGGLVLSLERMRKLEIDSKNRMARCGPGIITIELMKEAEKFGLFYPPDPASYDESVLGGNIAENAGGLHCKKYGVTKDYVIGLRAITVEGEIIKTGYYSRNDIFNLTSVLIGSEGLLAAITEIAVRLINLPVIGPTILASYSKPDEAASVVSEIIRLGIVPSVMEYMDGDAINCSNRYEKSIDIEKAEAILLLETTGENCRGEAKMIENICRQYNPVSLMFESDPVLAENLWKIRRNLSKAVKASVKYKIAEDVCVPPSKLPELVEFVSQLNNEYPIRINSYGHAGDGNLHVNFLTDNKEDLKNGLIKKGIVRLFRKTIELGGTLSGEHGIGLTKKDYLELEFNDDTIERMKDIKAVFDPNNLLNPGKMFPGKK